MQNVIALDLEGVLIPEIWQLVAKKTNISDLALTTRDISDYDTLMSMRINTLITHKLTIKDIQEVIKTVEPLEGAIDFLSTLKKQVEVIILSDTFIEFFTPLRDKLQYPFILCNALNIDETGTIISHRTRLDNGKSRTVSALQSINCKVAASGDSYNDLEMLQQANYGAWFLPPSSIVEKYPNIPVFDDYSLLADALLNALND